MGFSKNTQATRSSLMSVDSTLSEAITASQTYIPIASTTNFSTSVVAEIETTNEVVSFTDISTNTFKNSQDYSGSGWTRYNTTVTTDTTTAPDGTTTADKLQQNSGSTNADLANLQYTGLTSTSGTDYTISIYAKISADRDFLMINDHIASAFYRKTWFNLSTGAVGTVNANHTASISDEGDGWYRCSISLTSSITNTDSIIAFAPTETDGSPTVTDNEGSLFLWGAQLEDDATLSTYLPTTSAALEGLTGVTRGANGTTAQSASSSDSIQQLPFAVQGLLDSVSTTLSESIDATQTYAPLTSTNGFTDAINATIEGGEIVNIGDISVNDMKQSEAISTSPWTESETTIVTDALEAPDGETTADTLQVYGSGVIKQLVTGGMTINTDITYSFYVKQVVAGFARVIVFDLTDGFGGWWNTSTATWASTAVIGSGSVVGTTTTDVGNGWYRISITGKSAGAGIQVWHYLTDSDGSTARSGTAKIGLWGTQIEQASAATTYLPTTSAQLVGLTALTRGAEGTTAAAASSGDTVTQTPLSSEALEMPLRLKAISVASDGAGAGRFTLCDKVGTTLLDIDLPDESGYELDFGDDRGILFPNGIYVANSDNLTAYTLFTDKYSGTGLS